MPAAMFECRESFQIWISCALKSAFHGNSSPQGLDSLKKRISSFCSCWPLGFHSRKLLVRVSQCSKAYPGGEEYLFDAGHGPCPWPLPRKSALRLSQRATSQGSGGGDEGGLGLLNLSDYDSSILNASPQLLPF